VRLNIPEFVLSIILAIILAVCLIFALNGPSASKVTWSETSGVVGSDANDVVALEETTPYASNVQSTRIPFVKTTTPPPTPTVIPLKVGSERGDDLEDVLLLYDSTRISNFDINFCKIAEYYGLLCKWIPLNDTYLTDELLRDKQGNYFKLVGINAVTLLNYPQLMNLYEIAVLRSAIETGGIDLLISKFNEELDPNLLINLTDGVVQGVSKPLDMNRDWIVSSAAPDITREFTGQFIASSSNSPQNDFEILLSYPASTTSLISSTNDEGVIYPIFIKMEVGGGSIFIDAGDQGESLETAQLIELYYHMDDWDRGFAQVVPLMMVMRYALGEEVWHSSDDFANLTIDDPTLTEPFGQLSFIELLSEMEAHNFHTTIAMHPVSWFESEPNVVSLFLAYPNRYSVVQHGNNGDGYEFYRYNLSTDVEYKGEFLPSRPLVDQEADIIQGLARMEKHEILTGIPFERIMIFPWGISPEPTLELLKKYNFLATVNAQELPLDVARPIDWDFGMYQSNMNFGNFPTLTRRHPGTYEPFQPNLQPFVLDLFIDKPALFYSHAGELFASGIDTFNPVADGINNLEGEVEWRSLGYIITHLYLEKAEDDGSISVMMYGNHVIITNKTSEEGLYHLTKEETLNVPISTVTVNGHEFPYHVEEGLLMLDVLPHLLWELI
jgi:hypothetical protein